MANRASIHFAGIAALLCCAVFLPGFSSIAQAGGETAAAEQNFLAKNEHLIDLVLIGLGSIYVTWKTAEERKRLRASGHEG